MIDWLYYISYIYFFFIYGLALYLSSKNDDKIFKGVLLGALIFYLIGIIDYPNLFPYAYFIFFLIRKGYRKIRKK